ncbi:MAG TPA: phosphatidylglycerophosphatase A [Bryobacteraceae bacterium]|nr:phosphatidylglycerophosphatase A [Bryobacteraceae bacterium]
MRTLARLIATVFGLGYAPKAPGTVGSLGALLVAWLLYAYSGIGPRWLTAFAVVLAIPGIWAAGMVAKELGRKDPQIVVVDEVIGQWVALAGAYHLNWESWLLAFALFRLFDIVKPPPVRQLERLPGGMGIVADDAMAGLYAALVLFAAGWFNLY